MQTDENKIRSSNGSHSLASVSQAKCVFVMRSHKRYKI